MAAFPSLAPHRSGGRIVVVVDGRRQNKWKSEYQPLLDTLLPAQEVSVVFTRYSGHAIELARAAAQEGAAVVAAAGGDGSLNEVLNGVIRAAAAAATAAAASTAASTAPSSTAAGPSPGPAITAAPGVLGGSSSPLTGGLPAAAGPAIGLIPLGTGNDFARTLGWSPADLAAAIARLAAPPSLVDVGRLRCHDLQGLPVERYFLNIASCGASAAAVPHLGRFRWLGHWLGYNLAGACGLLQQGWQPLQLRLDGGEWSKVRHATLIAAGNGRYFGGGMQICSAADPCSGRLQVVSLAGVGLTDLLRFQHRLRTGDLSGLPGVASSSCRKLEVQVIDAGGRGSMDGGSGGGGVAGQFVHTQHRLPVECDGELMGWAPLTIDILPGALLFCK